ncbi:MAG TPA: DUF1570 domain-containing protein [Terriglobales bacterium]|nr:DUF1570 domain-containing protein [Terriglobales bacterium]
MRSFRLRPGLWLGLALTLSLAAPTWARSKPPAWIQVQSPHFLVVSNASTKAARAVAAQLERMRAVFQQAFPQIQVDPPMPILVLALRNRKDFQTIEPAAYLGKGKLNLAGYFQRSPERNFIAMRLDTQNETHPYAVIYHEYTHLLTFKDSDVIPLWLAEGLAEFYQTTEIEGNQVSLGKPDRGNLYLLQNNRMMPLATLFAVGHDSPYYHDQNQGSIFYAESWAFTHYLMMRDRSRHTQLLANYVTLLQQHVDPVTAASRAFGDLNKLQKALAQYVESISFPYVHFKLAASIREAAYPVAPVALPQANAVRADFMAHDGRYAEADALAHSVLQTDPHNLEALETLGFATEQQGQLRAARQWYGQAAALGSQDFLAQYYFGAMTLQSRMGNLNAATAARIETSLQAAIHLNPAFAPAYDRLAVLYAQQHVHLSQAARLEVQATQLEPATISYRLNGASILSEMGLIPDALSVLQQALPLADSPAEKQECENRIQEAQRYLAEQKQAEQYAAAQAAGAQNTTPGANDAANPIPPGPPQLVHRGVPADPNAKPQLLEASIQAVSCGPAHSLDMNLKIQGQVVSLHIPNYRAVTIGEVNFTPRGPFDPCTAMAGLHAVISVADHQVLGIALSR